MPSYCVNRKAQDGSGDHEVHDLDALYGCLPAPSNRVALGTYASCRGAVAAARAHFPGANGCRWCCPECHTS